jgi:protocatechuate 3,4-dioxygenase beta subunit
MGRFRMMLGETLAPNLYIEDVRSGGQSVFDSGFDIGAQTPSAVQVALRSGASVIEGTVLDENRKPVANAAVALVPPAPSRQNRARYRTATTNESGKFTIGSVGPGEYKMFAWRDVPAGAYFNSWFLARYEEMGVPVQVSGRNATVTVELTPMVPSVN